MTAMGANQLKQGYFRRGCRVREGSQRHTLAVDHRHPLRALAAFRFPDAGPVFFAGANLPAANASDQSCWPCASRTRKARQAPSHTRCSSQSRRRRQQVLGEGNRAGGSFQRAPARKTQSMPSNPGRFGMGLGSPDCKALGLGINGAIFAHCASVGSECSLAIHGTPPTAYCSRGTPHYPISDEVQL
jgi:hypothetical protein